ncbi:hypothetical protein ZTR_10277 [Talaromyces verruculosus]|nr:hypothetical protein ZTR_10277 [Talaromyces verruculosus]
MSEASLSERPKNEIDEENTNAMPTGTHSPPPEKGPEDAQTPTHLSSIRLSAIVFSLCLAVFLCGLDQTVIATATPKISDSFHALGDVGWWTSAYLLTTATFQLLYGKAYSLVTVKYVYLFAMLIFVLGSIICAVAPNSIALILGRAIAGVGASGLMSGAVLIIAQSAPLEKRPGLLGIITGIFGISSIAGPFIGGALTERSTWRWCFGINAPIGAVTMAIVAVCVKKIGHSDDTGKRATLTQKVQQFDLFGMVVILASLVCLILALQLGGSESTWNSGRVIALFVIAGVLFLAFLAMERWLSKSRTIPSTIVQSRSMWAAALFAACTAAAMFVAVTYLPIYFQALRGSSALRSGVMLTPLILGFVVMSVFAGILTNMIGYSNPAMIVGAVLSSVGAGLLTTFALDTPSSKWIGYQVLFGFGIGFGLQQPMLVVQTVLPLEDIPIGVSLITLSQMVSGSIFVSVSQSIFQNTIAEIHNVYPNVSVDTLLKTGATDIPGLFSDDQLLRVLPIYRNAIINTFYVALALSCLSILGALGTEWKSMKTKAVDEGVEQ